TPGGRSSTSTARRCPGADGSPGRAAPRELASAVDDAGDGGGARVRQERRGEEAVAACLDRRARRGAGEGDGGRALDDGAGQRLHVHAGGHPGERDAVLAHAQRLRGRALREAAAERDAAPGLAGQALGLLDEAAVAQRACLPARALGGDETAVARHGHALHGEVVGVVAVGEVARRLLDDAAVLADLVGGGEDLLARLVEQRRALADEAVRVEREPE